MNKVISSQSYVKESLNDIWSYQYIQTALRPKELCLRLNRFSFLKSFSVRLRSELNQTQFNLYLADVDREVSDNSLAKWEENGFLDWGRTIKRQQVAEEIYR